MTASPWAGSAALVDPEDPPVLARRRLARIRELVADTVEIYEELRELISEARQSADHELLGYGSWTSYVAAAVGQVAVSGRDERRELVQFLAEQGMSTRAIAPIVGAGKSTVIDDLATDRNRSVDAPPITGLNGKTYERPRLIVDPAPASPVDPPAPRDPRPEEIAARQVAEIRRDGRDAARDIEIRTYPHAVCVAAAITHGEPLDISHLIAELERSVNFLREYLP